MSFEKDLVLSKLIENNVNPFLKLQKAVCAFNLIFRLADLHFLFTRIFFFNVLICLYQKTCLRRLYFKRT